jgi:hypothetical protein
MVLARVRVVRGLPPARLPARLPAQLPAQLPARELGLLPARQLAHPLVQAPVPNLDRSNSSTAKLSDFDGILKNALRARFGFLS